MIVTTCRECLFLSLGYSFEIFSCEGLLRSVDVLYRATTTQDKENDSSIHEIPFHGDSRPEAIKRRRK